MGHGHVQGASHLIFIIRILEFERVTMKLDPKVVWVSPSRGKEVAFQRAGARMGKRSRADGGVHGASRAPGERGFCFKSKKKLPNDAVMASLVSPTRPSARQGWTPTRTCGCLSRSSRHRGLLTKHLLTAVSPATRWQGHLRAISPKPCRT